MTKTTAMGRVIGRTAFSERPIRVQVREGSLKGRTFDLTAEHAALTTIGPYQLMENVSLEIEDDVCRIAAKLPSDEPQSESLPTP